MVRIRKGRIPLTQRIIKTPRPITKKRSAAAKLARRNMLNNVDSSYPDTNLNNNDVDDDDADIEDGDKKQAAVDSNHDNDNNNNVEELPDDPNDDDDDESHNTDTLLPLPTYVRKRNNINRIPLSNHIVEIKLANILELLLQQLIEKGDALTRVAAKDLIMDMKTKGRNSPFGFVTAKRTSILDNNNSSLWDLVMLDEEVIAAVALDSTNITSGWWKKRVNHSFPWKACNRGLPNLTPIGERLSGTRKGQADDANRNKFGLFEVFGKRTPSYITVLEAMRKGDTTVFQDIFGGFTRDEAENIAFTKVKELLDKLAKEKNTTVPNILDGKDLRTFLNDYRSNFQALETKAREEGHVLADLCGLDPDEDMGYINPFIGIKFLTAINIFCTYDDIVDGLIGQTLCVLCDEDHKLRLLCVVGKKMMVQYCIGGGCVQQEFDPNEYERVLTTDGNYIVELYSTVTEFQNFLVIDMNATHDNHNLANTLNRKISIPGTDRFIRKITMELDVEECEYTCKLKFNGSTKCRAMRIHRLIKIVEEYHRRGIHYYQPLRKYLGLKGGDTFQVVDRFKCECDTSEASLKKLKRRFKHLENKEWLHVATAIVCDVDHTVGRSIFWMNSNMLLLTCSHQYNTQLSNVRRLFGDWGFAFSTMKYSTGKD